jgi:hypothetical protein
MLTMTWWCCCEWWTEEMRGSGRESVGEKENTVSLLVRCQMQDVSFPYIFLSASSSSFIDTHE